MLRPATSTATASRTLLWWWLTVRGKRRTSRWSFSTVPLSRKPHRQPSWRQVLTSATRDYIAQANLGKSGSCHTFRHTMATLMLEGGANLRYIQQMLGHADLNSTEIYTHVAIRKLQQIHAATHPGATLERKAGAVTNNDTSQDDDEQRKAALLETLDAEADEEESE